MPYITKLRVSEIATALSILLKGPVILEVLDALDNNEEFDFDQFENVESKTSFNIHQFKR